jgi:hypothetical protein
MQKIFIVLLKLLPGYYFLPAKNLYRYQHIILM